MGQLLTLPKTYLPTSEIEAETGSHSSVTAQLCIYKMHFLVFSKPSQNTFRRRWKMSACSLPTRTTGAHKPKCVNSLYEMGGSEDPEGPAHIKSRVWEAALWLMFQEVHIHTELFKSSINPSYWVVLCALHSVCTSDVFSLCCQLLFWCMSSMLGLYVLWCLVCL